MSEFAYGFGSAIADQIQSQVDYENSSMLSKFEQDQIQNIKTTINQLALAVSNAIDARNHTIDQINALDDGDYKDQKIAEFKAIDDGGWFTPSFTTQIAAVQKIADLLGIDSTLPDLKTLGFFPIAAMAAVPAATWISAAVMVSVAGALVLYFGTYTERLIAIKFLGAEAVAKADPTVIQAIAQNATPVVVGILAIGLIYFLYTTRTRPNHEK